MLRLQARQPEYSGSIPGGGGKLSNPVFRLALGPNQPPIGSLGPLSAAVKRPVRDANHSSPSSLLSTKGRILLFSAVSRLGLLPIQCLFVDILLRVKHLCAKTPNYATAQRHEQITKLSVRYEVLKKFKFFTLNDL